MNTAFLNTRQAQLTDHPNRGYLAAGGGTPVVMLHSSLASKAQWSPLVMRMARRFHAIAIDLCGYGDNPAIDAGAAFTLDDEVKLVASRLDGLLASHARVHLVGHSYGGLVALRFAQQKPERVASLVLYDPVAFRMLDDNDPALRAMKVVATQIIDLVTAGRRNDAARAFVDIWNGKGAFASLAAPVQGSIVRRIDKVAHDFHAAWRWPLDFADIRAIEAPTLLLAGNRSPMIAQRIVKSLGAELADRRIRWVDAGHMGPITAAHRVNPWIEAFVDVRTACDQLEARARIDKAGEFDGATRSVEKERHDEHYQVI